MVIAAWSLTLEGRRRQQVVRSLRALSGPTGLKFLRVPDVKGMEYLEAARLDNLPDSPPNSNPVGRSIADDALKTQGNSLEAP